MLEQAITDALQQPLKLPCGEVIPNRLAKAAMTEGLADPRGLPGEELCRLYRAWSDGGAGLLITGNVQIDWGHLERPGNVVIDRPLDTAQQLRLRAWAEALPLPSLPRPPPPPAPSALPPPPPLQD